jgi:hypothetical protein
MPTAPIDAITIWRRIHRYSPLIMYGTASMNAKNSAIPAFTNGVWKISASFS